MNSAERYAKSLAKKADRTERISRKFKEGAKGEELVGEYISNEVLDKNSILISDLMSNTGGNIDHILLTPKKLYLIDSKNWGAKPTITKGKLYVGKYNVDEQINSLENLNSDLFTNTSKEFKSIIICPKLTEDLIIKYKNTIIVSLTTFKDLHNKLEAILYNSETIDEIEKIILKKYPKMGEKKNFNPEQIPLEKLVSFTASIYGKLTEEERFTFLLIKQWEKGKIKRQYIYSKEKFQIGYFDRTTNILKSDTKDTNIDPLMKIVNGEKAELENITNIKIQGLNKIVKTLYVGLTGSDLSHLDDISGYIIGEVGKNKTFLNISQVKYSGGIVKLGLINTKTGKITYFDKNKEGLVNQFWYYFCNNI